MKSHENHTSSDNLEVMNKLNPEWSSKKGTGTLTNEKYVSWLTDPKEWSDWRDTTTSNLKDYINYVVGTPSLEMYVKSYNAFLSKHPETYTASSKKELAKKLKCEYITDTKYKANGYRIGFESVPSENWVNDGYYQEQSSLFSVSPDNPKAEWDAYEMYNSVHSSNYWLASPSACSNNDVFTLGCNGYNILCSDARFNPRNYCPLVSLKSGVTLNLKTEN